MNEKLELQLVKKYPKILRDYKGDIMQTALHFGCQNDDGWYNLLDKCMEKLQYFCDLCTSNEKEVQVIATTIKEKYGSLRFYTSIYGANSIESSIIDDIISEAESKSSQTCEVTGENGTLCIKNGWYMTLCYEQARKLGFKACNPETEKYWESKDKKEVNS
jgi:hypothetical protein